MNRFSFPRTLPLCAPIQPAFIRHFSGWHLGMGLPQSLTGLLPGLFRLGEDNPGCRRAALGMALWGMQAHPLAPDMGQWGVSAVNLGLKTDAALSRIMILNANLPRPQDSEALDTWYALARQDDRSLILRFLTVVLSDPAKGSGWLHHVWQDLIHMGRPEIPKAALDMVSWNDTALPLKARMEADWAFHCLPSEDALPVIEGLDPATWGLWRAYAAGETLLRMGRKGEGKAALAGLWQTIPWHVNLTLKLYDLFNAPALADSAATEDAAILAYSWNKADLLADTLDSLLRSDIGKAKVFTLNNGSTDHTAEVLTQAMQKFGSERFRIETLPVNVGAPAARNWLMSLPELRAAKWAAFLDDDIVLPEDWLLRLLGPVQDRDDIGAVGCRITAAVPPFSLQSADYNLFPTPPAETEPGALPNRVLLFDNCAGSLDTGMFTYTRPCLSVSGCCHLVNMRSVEKTGGFDLRYTPSQFDDLDRDLRSNLAGMPALYVGGLAIRHIQHSSLAKSRTAKQIGQVMGNKLKLDTKYSDEELTRLGRENRLQLWADLEQKTGYLVDRMGQRA
ncbi:MULTISPECIES: glycosyltransferase [unclassified Pseudodesulfovibrio]|uniref:glycosyltransferase family A protein n=1 Tax=unclassified Pseudodesulfovibrio TaxID=2661612 RepID=UPI000FEB6CF4|nr:MULTISPECIES: glycosyltransferase [unclassified Pseudodesulfovibrio]MCJ2165827.1 glycosyltransferase [Pseudodesulfovibrio sp. S3-i]RWU02743.1 glycosyltransferase [Pseudodesulfovibrio sp. S3]